MKYKYAGIGSGRVFITCCINKVLIKIRGTRVMNTSTFYGLRFHLSMVRQSVTQQFYIISTGIGMDLCHLIERSFKCKPPF